MKIKMKSNGSLPNCWKSCGVSYDDWQELQSGKEVDASSVPDSIKNLVEVVKTSQPKKNKGEK